MLLFIIILRHFVDDLLSNAADQLEFLNRTGSFFDLFYHFDRFREGVRAPKVKLVVNIKVLGVAVLLAVNIALDKLFSAVQFLRQDSIDEEVEVLVAEQRSRDQSVSVKIVARLPVATNQSVLVDEVDDVRAEVCQDSNIIDHFLSDRFDG